MNGPIVQKDAWEATVKGFEITGIAIRDAGILQMLSRQSVPAAEASMKLDGDMETRIYSIFLGDPPETNIEFQGLENMPYPVLGVSRAPFERPGGLVACKSQDGDVWPLGGGNGPAESIAPGQKPFTRRLKCFQGYTYSLGGGRKIYKRVQTGVWERVEGIAPPESGGFRTAGFEDMDGFSERDLYAVGGHGDVWHFDGNAWRQMGFPTNEQLATVTCGGDGNVYITGEGGNLWVGEKSTWRLLAEPGSSVLCNDSRWFNGQLWMASDYQLRVWDGKAIVLPEHNGKPVIAAGHMDVHDGILVVADLWGVEMFDGNQWTDVVSPFEND